MTEAILPKTDRLAAPWLVHQTGRTDPLGLASDLASDMDNDIAKARALTQAILLMADGIDREEDGNAFKFVVDGINAALDDIHHKQGQLCRQLHRFEPELAWRAHPLRARVKPRHMLHRAVPTGGIGTLAFGSRGKKNPANL